MAKRKAVRPSSRKRAAKRRGGAKARAAAKKTASARKTRKAGARSAPRGRKAAPKAATRRSKPAGARKAARAGAKARASKKVARARVRTVSPARKTASAGKVAPARKTGTPKPREATRRAPGLNRERRTIVDDDLIPSTPSSLDMDRTASAARSGRRELLERYEEHTETSPALTGGDVDADWESAYSVGDEAPGGDNPTPDQDIVDDIGRAIGVQYQDNEELKGEKKITERDRHRWELDPASSDDWEDR